MSNSKGSYRVTAQNDLAAYDKLPRSVRQAIANGAFNLACPPLLTWWKRSRGLPQDARKIAAQVGQWETKRIAKDRKRVWGISEPAPKRKRKS